MTAVPGEEPSSIPTRPSLLNRLKEGDDQQSWREFYQVYGKLVRDFAIRAGVTDTEADEVVQEVAIGVARHLPGFSYDPKVCRFKTWLLNQASWRIRDQLKKRYRQPPGSAGVSVGATPSIAEVADPSSLDLDALFQDQWRKHLLDSALSRLTTVFSLKQIQIFDLIVVKEWSAIQVARSLGVSVANVYVTKHRVATAMKREVQKLERSLEGDVSTK